MTMMTETLVIPNDVSLVPVLELPEGTRDQLDWSEGDVAITRLRSRTPSKIINAEFADLFNEFQVEKTIVEAVMHYSLLRSSNPQETLENAFPLLQRFVETGLLIPPSGLDEEDEKPLLRGERVDEFTIVRCLRTLQDSEIYQAKASDGQTIALKMMRPRAGQIIERVFQHEAKILRQLNGRSAPQLISQGKWAQRLYLASEWCNGSDLMRVASERRGQRDHLLALGRAVLDAYAQLHAQGVMHGDIHPGNILVSGEGGVMLIDFGLAHMLDSPAPYRGGVPFYYEPEYAAAFLNKERPPIANPASEQYAIAALLYQMITGTSYLNFSLEESVLYRQILEEVPQPFSDHGIEVWSEVEVILRRALAKDPGQRFQSVAAFRDAWTSVGENDTRPQLDNTNHYSSLQPRPLVDAVLEQLQLDGSLLREGLSRQPYASINYGAAGVAYALYRMACVRQNPELLAWADVWLTRAEQAVGDEAGFYNAELDMGVENIGRISPYHTPSGVIATRFFLAQAMGDMRSQLAALTEFVAAASQPCPNLDITLGKAGVILIGAKLNEAYTDKSWGEQSGLLPLGNTLLSELWQIMDSYASLGPDCELSNLGIAHGWAGLLYATLRWHEATGCTLPENLTMRLDELAAFAEGIGRGCQWLWEVGPGEMSMSGWCNGSAGYIFLWSSAFRILGDPVYRKLAIGAGWHAWEDTAVIGNLCCGLAGRSYSLAHLYKLTKDKQWLDRSRLLATQAVYHIQHSQAAEYDGFEMSLYKGELAVALLLTDLEKPDSIAFPFFE